MKKMKMTRALQVVLGAALLLLLLLEDVSCSSLQVNCAACAGVRARTFECDVDCQIAGQYLSVFFVFEMRVFCRVSFPFLFIVTFDSTSG